MSNGCIRGSHGYEETCCSVCGAGAGKARKRRLRCKFLGGLECGTGPGTTPPGLFGVWCP
jgi:hypothetical protein